MRHVKTLQCCVNFCKISIAKSLLCPFKFNMFIVNAIEQYHIKLFNFQLGTNICHRNYLNCHNEHAKHKAAIAFYILSQYSSTLTQLEECVMRAKYWMSVEKKNGFNILLNFSYWITEEVLALAKFTSLCKLHTKSWPFNWWELH